MSLENRIDELKSEFGQFSQWEDRYRHIIQKGKNLDPLNEEYRTEKNKVKGCQSQVWLNAELQEDKIKFQADSDAAIVRGIIATLLQIYDEATPQEVLTTKPTFLDDIGLRQHLSMSRANGLSAMLKQISLYAVALQSQMQQRQ